MKGKWNQRVYLDLFAGSGRSRLKKSGRIVENCAMKALHASVPFDSYVLCDADLDKQIALKKRVTAIGKSGSCTFFNGDSNRQIKQIRDLLPRLESGKSSLSFCLLDPYKFEDLKFSTIEYLAERYIDFLVFIPSYMEGHRFKDQNLDDPKRLSEFLGNTNWLDRWPSKEKVGEKFGNFIVEEFGRSMQILKVKYHGIEQTVPIRLEEKNRTLYHLAFFSRNDLGLKFFKDCKKLVSPQLALEF